MNSYTWFSNFHKLYRGMCPHARMHAHTFTQNKLSGMPLQFLQPYHWHWTALYAAGKRHATHCLLCFQAKKENYRFDLKQSSYTK